MTDNTPADPTKESSSLVAGRTTPSVGTTVGVAVACVLVATPQGRRVLRRTVSTLASGVGFVTNTVWDVVTHHSKKRSQWDAALSNLDDFLAKSGVSDELNKSVTNRFLHNLGLLVKVQEQVLSNRQEEVQLDADKPFQLPTASEAARYMRFATAVYGYAMIQSVEVELNPDVLPYATTEEEILRHTQIPKAEDILVADVEQGTGMDSLRHMVAVDHANKAVVFCVRGTFDLSGVVVDLVAYAEPFCGGQAHAGMAQMARVVWKQAEASLGDKIQSVPKDYKLIITGHSLGAGVACLMTIMAYHENLLPSHVKIRCLAYAPPPVFYPLDAAKEAVPNITAYVHDHDVVPSLSVSSFRRTLAQIAVFDEEFRHEHWLNMMRMHWGKKEIPSHIVQAILEARKKPEQLLRKVEGAPMLSIPAHVVVWLKSDEGSTGVMEQDEPSFSTVLCDPLRYAESGIFLNSNMISDHFPPKYQLALEDILAQKAEKETKQDS